MANGAVVLFAGGTGNPFFSTDSGVALRAAELNADMILMARNVDGVYDKDPNKYSDAVLLPCITYDEAISRGLQVMDQAALLLCRDNKIPMIRLFDLNENDGLIRAARGELGFGSVVCL
jgi:uridylate kinase